MVPIMLVVAFSCPSIGTTTSSAPRTSLSFQSFFGESGCELWQLTQASLAMRSATATRTTDLPWRLSERTNAASGSLANAASASVAKTSSFRPARSGKGNALYNFSVVPDEPLLSASLNSDVRIQQRQAKHECHDHGHGDANGQIIVLTWLTA
jgi:hypothetical protein